MKFRNAFLITAISATALVAALCPKPIPADKEAVLVQAINAVLASSHYSPQTMTDDFSKKTFKLYLDRMDAGRRFLTQQDVDELTPFETQLDDQLKASDLTFFNKSVELIEKGIGKAELAYQKALTMPIDFTKNESVELDGDKKPYAKDDAELADMWRKMVKYEVMTRLASKLDDKAKGKESVKDKSEDDLQKSALTEVTKQYNDYFKRIKKQKRNEHLSTYLNSAINVFDPHSEYFEPIEKQNFDIGMSGRLIGIGARLQTDLESDYTKVSEVTIGGPAHKQGELKDGDLIMKVAQGDKDPVDVSGMDLNEVVSMIRGKLATEVRLTVKAKTDSKVKVISIIREEIIIDEGFAKSLVIQADKTADRIGYIKLPKFYADFDNENGHQCAEDVEIEIEKLKKANVKGIVLDLRNNGGGSLRDVVKMAGFFVEEGPMVQVKSRTDKPDVLNDTDPSVQYTGPFVIMVNEFSASASEIMAAAMQDYGRAIIVGTPTYGKGTVQRFVNLDRAVNRNGNGSLVDKDGKALGALGDLKITIQKFFRVDGGSTQLKGVTPDIILPDSYMEIPVGEKDTEHPLAWTQINPVKYSQSVVDLKKMSQIVANSQKRISANSTFTAYRDNAKRMKMQRDNSQYPLNLKEYRALEAKRDAEIDKFKAAIKPIDSFVAENLTDDLTALNATKDSSKIIRNREWMKDIKKDAHLYETLSIVRDLIQNATFKTAAADSKKD